MNICLQDWASVDLFASSVKSIRPDLNFGSLTLWLGKNRNLLYNLEFASGFNLRFTSIQHNMQSIEKDRRKSGLGKPHNIILTNFSLVSKTSMAAVQATDKAAELDSSLLVTHSTAGHTLSREKRGCLV